MDDVAAMKKLEAVEEPEEPVVYAMFVPRVALLLVYELAQKSYEKSSDVHPKTWKHIAHNLCINEEKYKDIMEIRAGHGSNKWPDDFQKDDYFSLLKRVALETINYYELLENIAGIFNGLCYRKLDCARFPDGRAKFIMHNESVVVFFEKFGKDSPRIRNNEPECQKRWEELVVLLQDAWCWTNPEGLADLSPTVTIDPLARRELASVEVVEPDRDSLEPDSAIWRIETDGTLIIAPPAGWDKGYLRLSLGWDENGCPCKIAPWFEDAERIVRVRVEPGVVAPDTIDHLFKRCINLEEADLSGLDVSQVTNMLYMFGHCKKLCKLDLSGWNTQSLRTFGWAFCRCESLTELDLSEWDVSNVWEMSGAFVCCSSLRSLNLSGWDVSAATDMENLFLRCSSLSSLDLSDWRGAHPRIANGMFWGCRSLEELDLSSWDMSAVEDVRDMFRGCSGLQKLQVDGWVLPPAAKAKGMLLDCERLKVRGLDVSAVEDLDSVCDLYC